MLPMPGLIASFRRLVLGSAVTLSGGLAYSGCASSHHPAPQSGANGSPTTHATLGRKPIIDFGRGAAGFPLASTRAPASTSQLVQQLTAGYAARVELPTTQPTVMAIGDLPHLKSLAIDLTGGHIKKDYRPSSLHAPGKLEPFATVRSLSYRAEPLWYDSAQQSLSINASDVSLSLLHGRGEKTVMVMTDAREGEARFSISLENIRQMLLDTAKENGSKAALLVQDTQIKLTSETPRSLAAEVHIDGFWILLPTTLTLKGRIDVDSQFNAHLSGLSCDGGEVGGPILAGLISGALKKYDGKTMPLAAFPGDRLRMHDLQIAVDDALHVYASFGR